MAIFKVLMFPWLAHGHVYPYLALAQRLSKTNKFHIYFCSTSVNLESIRNSLNQHSPSSWDHLSIELIELRLPPHPQLPPHYHTTKNIPLTLIPTLIHAFQLSAPNFSDIITRLNPDLLIYDMFQPWSAKLASSQGIPAVHFNVGGSTALSFLHHLHTHKSAVTFPVPAIYLHDYERQNQMAEEELVKVQEDDEGLFFGVFKLSCDIVLINSCCMWIEGMYIDYLSTLSQRRIVPVGPLVQENAADETDSWIMNWLSKKRESSTLYISFGSETYFSREQIQEIAKGLELCKVNFIWVARSPVGSDHINVEEALPEGFIDLVKERGILVQKWAPQAAILASPAVGGFMSHCGWNAIKESIYFGVPVVALPLKFEQPLNSRLVVEAAFGVEVARDEKGKFDGEAVGRAIDEVMLGESGERLRRRVREMSEKTKVEEEETFCGVVEELTKICVKKSASS
ncbi:beta-D-glucosyl crocetin beta-1,6-glucosyltransferase-like [Sesamum indicum]|uniref:Glycosyltransferase n=1 Tax=Sesamum indicum TaxID=4182 RepID=A0A6I9SW07_SESIN|nr:beta-D-glucosyl crocetin beta-1,6-glucosyltransferase-like [Sesamum indicum]